MTEIHRSRRDRISECLKRSNVRRLHIWQVWESGEVNVELAESLDVVQVVR